MMYNEFTERTGIYLDNNMYSAVEDAYYEFSGNKDEFCKAYKANKDGLAEKIAKAACEKYRISMDKKDEEFYEVRDDLEEAEAKIKRLESQLEREQEWKHYIDEDAVSDNDYGTGKAAACQMMDDGEAKAWIANEFGFAESKIEIIRTRGVFEISRHRELRKIGEVNRDPWYNATDWYYVQFQVCGMIYEAYNGTLIQH